MRRGPPPPTGSAPAVSRDIVNTVKKKLAAPSSAPPPSMNIKSIINRGTAYGGLDEDDEDENDDDVSDYEDNEPPNEFPLRDDSIHTRRDDSFNESNPLKDENRGKKNSDNNHRKGSFDGSRNRSDSDRRYKEDSDQRDYDERGKNDRENSDNNSRQGRFTQSKQGRNRHDDDDDYNDDDYRGSNDGSHGYESDRNNGNKNRFDNRDNLKSNSENRSINPGHAANKKDSKDTDREGRPSPLNSSSASSRDNLKSDAKADRNTAPAPKGAPKNGKLQMYNFQPILKATYRELRGFVLLPCEVGITTRCYIERTKGPGNMFSPIYSLCADLEDGTGRELMVCRKVLQSMSSHYVFSLKSEDLYRKRDQRSRLFLGKLRSTSSSEYVLYDNGMIRSTADRDDDNEHDGDDQPDNKGGEAGNPDEVSLFRKEVAVIHYNTKKRPAPLGVRGCEVCISSKGSDEAVDTLRNADAKDSGSYVPGQCLQQPFEKIRDAGKQNQMMAKKCYVMHEKTSRYDPLSSCLVDFKGRANMASVKNFQLVESYCTNTDARKDQETDADTPFILQVGKTTDECFNMDYRHPLSMMQAFAIAIARFDAKLYW
mmetsp:Transcript_18881/g.18190  ORF Transcript_18881/g.18190 Transcript_18881/m.18190 type:complete len:597 (+) Transcript_18881:44-1834(+)